MKKYILFIFFIFYFSQFAYSADTSGYVGGNLGQSDFDTNITTGTATLDEEDLGWKIYGGANINEYLAVEIQYADFGAATLNGVNGSTFTLDGTAFQFITTAQLDAEADSVGFSAVVGYDINEYIRPFVKLGGHSWDLAIVQTASGAFATGTVASDDGFDLFFGGGLKIKATDNFSAVLEIERYDFGGQVNKTLNLFSAGILITF
jgi:hypothetical protein